METEKFVISENALNFLRIVSCSEFLDSSKLREEFALYLTISTFHNGAVIIDSGELLNKVLVNVKFGSDKISKDVFKKFKHAMSSLSIDIDTIETNTYVWNAIEEKIFNSALMLSIKNPDFLKTYEMIKSDTFDREAILIPDIMGSAGESSSRLNANLEHLFLLIKQRGGSFETVRFFAATKGITFKNLGTTKNLEDPFMELLEKVNIIFNLPKCSTKLLTSDISSIQYNQDLDNIIYNMARAQQWYTDKLSKNANSWSPDYSFQLCSLQKDILKARTVDERKFNGRKPFLKELRKINTSKDDALHAFKTWTSYMEQVIKDS
jgi:hypothetical protein